MIVGMLAITLYNPLAATEELRLQEISHEFKKHDVVALIGSHTKAYEAIVKQRLIHHTAYKWGWSRGRWTNRAAGITIMLGKQWKEASVVRLWVPPAGLAGRGAAMRIRQGKLDLTILALYFPPRAGGVYKQCVERVMDFAQSVMRELPGRTTPVVLMDLNDGMGKEVVGGFERPIPSTAVGDACRSVEHWAGHSMREFAEEHDMVVVDSFYHTGPTYYGAGTKSYTDHILLPQGVLPNVEYCCTAMGAMKRLQIIQTVAPRDIALWW